MKQMNEQLCVLAQKGDATALDSLIDNNKSFISKVANDLFCSMNLAQSGLNLDTDDLKQAGNLGLWKAVPKFDAARDMKFLIYAAPAIRNAMMDMVREAFAAFEQWMVTEDNGGQRRTRMVSVTSVFRWTMFCREKSSCGASKPQPTPTPCSRRPLWKNRNRAGNCTMA